MTFATKFLVAIVGIGALLIGYWLVSPFFIVEEFSEASPMDEFSTVSRVGTFESFVHETSGTVQVIETAQGSVIRFENFSVENGPDLYVYLATNEEVDDFVDLGELKGTVGSANYAVPFGTDLSQYDHVVIWCRPFKVNFGYAVLS